jgi:hypothetical protein
MISYSEHYYYGLYTCAYEFSLRREFFDVILVNTVISQWGVLQKVSPRLRKRRGCHMMVGEGRLSTSHCYERIFTGTAWWERGNRELERSTAAMMKLIIDSIPDSIVPLTDCS